MNFTGKYLTVYRAAGLYSFVKNLAAIGVCISARRETLPHIKVLGCTHLTALTCCISVCH